MALLARERRRSKRSDSFFTDVLKEFETKHTCGTDSGVLMLSEDHLLCKKQPKSFWQKLLPSCSKGSYFDGHKLQNRRYATALFPTLFSDKTEDAESPELDIQYLPLTFIPNFVIEEILNDPDAFRSVPLHLRSHAVLVMVDVSGFTPLTEMYSRKERSGADDLASELNVFMSNLASTLMSFGGDILNFAGDAFLCQWEGKEDADLTSLTGQAFACAVYIQTVLTTDIRRMLQVKIGMALGKTKTQILGSPSEFLLFVVSGTVLVHVRSAEELCGPGEIVISEDVFHCLKGLGVKLYHTTDLEHGFVKISGFEKQVENKPSLSNSGRLELFQECSPQIIALSRAFMIPILRDVKTTDQLNYLSEVTKVTILFMVLPNVDVVDPINLDHALETILSSVKNYGGVLNKVLLFDKGCTFLAIFGLPGLKHLNDASRSLLCAHSVIQGLKKYDLEVSTGISSGTCFCGIIGHYQRQEYTVIGWRVNMACRLMTTYSDYLIVLDADTYDLSRKELGDNCFTELEKRKLKGIESVPAIYAYNPKAEIGLHVETTGSLSKSLTVIAEEEHEKIQFTLLSLKTKEKHDSIHESGMLPVIIIEGERGSGKSFLLYYSTAVAIELNYQILACSAISQFVQQPFITIAQMLCKFFNILSLKSVSKEAAVLNFLSDKNDPYIFCLNDILQVKFPVPQNFPFQLVSINKQIERLLKDIITAICNSDRSSPLLIAIDDADLMDAYSWQLLKNIVSSERVVVLFTRTRKNSVSCIADAVIQTRACHHINLDKFSDVLLVPIICWFLDVQAVHKDIANFLKMHISGDFQLLEEILLCPSFINSTRIVPRSSVSDGTLETMFYTGKALFMSGEEEAEFVEPNICDVKVGIAFHRVLLSGSFEDAVKERLNILKIQDRVVLKRAAVLSFSFYFHCLETANSDLTSHDLTESVCTLVEQNILCFDSISCIGTDPVFVSKKHPILLRIKTGLEYITTKVRPFGKLTEFLPLQKLKFSTLAFQTCILENMTKDQTIAMHIEVIKELEKEGMFCLDCKNQQIIFHSRTSHNVSEEEETGRKCLLMPSFDLRKCCCLVYRANSYGKISSIYCAIGNSLSSILFLVKAAEVYLHNDNAIKALTYVQHGINQFPSSFFKPGSFKTELDIHPLVIKASLYRVKAEILSSLNNTYDAANIAMQAMQTLGISILEFFEKMRSSRMLEITEKCSELQRQEITRCLSVVCKSYYYTGDYKRAFHLADCHMHLMSTSSDSFFDNINFEILYYKCRSKHNALSVEAVENTLLEFCHERLLLSKVPVDILEIRSIARAYASIIQHNLCQRKLNRAETVCSEAVRLLKCVHENEELPLILSLGVQSCLHNKKFGFLLMYLNNLRTVSIEIGSKVYLAVFYCSIIELSGNKEAHSCFGDRLTEFNEFLQNYDDYSVTNRPRDVFYFAAARLALWCLEVKLIDDETTWVSTFTYWYNLANLLGCRSMDSYWSVGARLAMIRISIIINFRVKNLSPEEKEEQFLRIEEKYAIQEINTFGGTKCLVLRCTSMKMSRNVEDANVAVPSRGLRNQNQTRVVGLR